MDELANFVPSIITGCVALTAIIVTGRRELAAKVGELGERVASVEATVKSMDGTVKAQQATLTTMQSSLTTLLAGSERDS